MILKLAEMVSLALTSPTIVLAIAVVFLWWKEAWAAAIATKRDPVGWFTLGVAIGFVGSIMDNLYWGIAWSAAFLELDSTLFWFAYGVLSNVPFRQLAGCVAAYCHVRSALAYRDNKIELKRFHIFCWVSLWGGVAYVCGLWLISGRT